MCFTDLAQSKSKWTHAIIKAAYFFDNVSNFFLTNISNIFFLISKEGENTGFFSINIYPEYTI